MTAVAIGAPRVRLVSVGVDAHSFVSHGTTRAGTPATVVAGAEIRHDDEDGSPVSHGLVIASGPLAAMIAARAAQGEEPLPVRAVFDGVCWDVVSAARRIPPFRTMRIPARIARR